MLEGPTAHILMTGLATTLALPIGMLANLFIRASGKLSTCIRSFGVGVLLAAVMAEITNQSIYAEQSLALVIGALIGGGAYSLVNMLLDGFGAYLRDSALTLNFWRTNLQKRQAGLVDLIKKSGIYEELSPDQFHFLLNHVSYREFHKGMTIYRHGDPSNCLYLVFKGEIQLLDSSDQRRTVEFLGEGSAVGRLSFLTGTKRRMDALAASHARLFIIPRQAFFDLMDEFPELRSQFNKQLKGTEVKSFLEERHDMTHDEVREWQIKAVNQLEKEGFYDPPKTGEHAVRNNQEELVKTNRIELFRDLSEADRQLVVSRMGWRSIPKGEYLFRTGERANHLYFLQTGEISLIYPDNILSEPLSLKPGDVFGQRSFLANGIHSLNAVATTDCICLVLRRKDYNFLQETSETFKESIDRHLKVGLLSQPKVISRFNISRTAEWVNREVRGQNPREKFFLLSDLEEQLYSLKNSGTAVVLGYVNDLLPRILAACVLVVSSSAWHLAMLAGIFLTIFSDSLSASHGLWSQGYKTRWFLVTGALIMLSLIHI